MQKHKAYLLYFMVGLASTQVGYTMEDKPNNELENTSLIGTQNQQTSSIQELVEQISTSAAPAAQDAPNSPFKPVHQLGKIKSKYLMLEIFAYADGEDLDKLWRSNKQNRTLVQNNPLLSYKIAYEPVILKKKEFENRLKEFNDKALAIKDFDSEREAIGVLDLASSLFGFMIDNKILPHRYANSDETINRAWDTMDGFRGILKVPFNKMMKLDYVGEGLACLTIIRKQLVDVFKLAKKKGIKTIFENYEPLLDVVTLVIEY